MAATMLRCCACKHEWDADVVRGVLPGCPSCEADNRVVVEVCVIHFDPPSKTPGRGLNVAACNPKLKVGAGQRFTGEKDAVTCRDCLQSELYKGAADPGTLPLPKLKKVPDPTN